jgi:hypothetical protein
VTGEGGSAGPDRIFIRPLPWWWEAARWGGAALTVFAFVLVVAVGVYATKAVGTFLGDLTPSSYGMLISAAVAGYLGFRLARAHACVWIARRYGSCRIDEGVLVFVVLDGQDGERAMLLSDIRDIDTTPHGVLVRGKVHDLHVHPHAPWLPWLPVPLLIPTRDAEESARVVAHITRGAA